MRILRFIPLALILTGQARANVYNVTSTTTFCPDTDSSQELAHSTMLLEPSTGIEPEATTIDVELSSTSTVSCDTKLSSERSPYKSSTETLSCETLTRKTTSCETLTTELPHSQGYSTSSFKSSGLSPSRSFDVPASTTPFSVTLSTKGESTKQETTIAYVSTSTYYYSTTTVTVYLGKPSSTSPTGEVSTGLSTTKVNPVTPMSGSSSSLATSMSTSTLTTQHTVSSTLVSSSECSYVDIFAAVSTDAPPSQYFPDGSSGFTIPESVDNGQDPIETNKFYANLFLGSQSSSVFTYPYSVWWNHNVNSAPGLAVSHTKPEQLVFGPEGPASQGGAPKYYINPVKILSLGFSATQFTNVNCDLKVSDMGQFSVLAALYDNTTSYDDRIDFVLAQGMGFVTGVYHGGLRARIFSEVGIDTVLRVSSTNTNSKTLKYRVKLYDGVLWLLYITVPTWYQNELSLAVETSQIVLSGVVDGIVVQIAPAPGSESQEFFYDVSAGTYITDVDLTGYTEDCGVSVRYSINYSTDGNSTGGEPLVFALPHQEGDFTDSTLKQATGIYLFTPTKGYAQAYLTDTLEFHTFLESKDIGFLPDTTLTKHAELQYSAEQIQLMASSANKELAVDMVGTIKGLSTYYAGKYITKFSFVLLTLHSIIKDSATTRSTLEIIKATFDAVFDNQLQYKLQYDLTIGGITSASTPSENFGFSYFNDHHFHLGYFLSAAAIVGWVDQDQGGTWARDHEEYFSTLVRDVNNPSTDDAYFPVLRMFDWYHGHSWAAGLFESSDGKNQESSSEDYNFAYAMKMWGQVIGDLALETRGNLMLSIMKKSMNSYYYYADDNTVQPAVFTPNKVGGIVFENKIDHTTFFGTNPEYIHGIHMLPTLPVSSIIRGPEFTRQEWDQTLASLVGSVRSGWTGILRLNQALFDPEASYEFFSQENFDYSLLDDGQSRTWSLAYSAGVMNMVS